MKFVTKAVLITLLAAAAAPASAFAQESRLTISFTPSVATVSGDSELALAGTVGYRFTDHFSFEGDITWIDAAAGGFGDRRFDFDGRLGATTPITTIVERFGDMFGGRNQLPSFPSGIIGGVTGRVIAVPALTASTDGQTWIGTMGIRYEPSVQTAWFRPYVATGLGINYTTQEFSIAATSLTEEFDASTSHSGLAFSAGGGVNIKLADALWLAADARYFRLSRDRDMMRLGGGVTLKF